MKKIAILSIIAAGVIVAAEIKRRAMPKSIEDQVDDLIDANPDIFF